MRCCSIIVLLCFVCGCVDGGAKQGEAPVPKAPASKSSSLVDARAPGATDPDAPKDFTELASGLKYKVLRNTNGKKPKASDTVFCNYRGTLDDGTEFDSSYSRSESIEFPLGGVIPGWTEGLQYCPEGGMVELEIPSNLGYGPGGSPPKIPGGATLHFIVELIEIR